MIISSFINKFRRLLVFCITVNLLFFSGLAQSNIVFNQLPKDGGNAAASFHEEQSADNFMLAADTELSMIYWFGSFRNPLLSDNSFSISLFMDNGNNLPNNDPFQVFNVTASRTFTNLSNSSPGNPGDIDPSVFLFSASITPIDLLANIPYYLSVVHPNDALFDEFYWLQSDAGVNGSIFTRNTSISNAWSRNNSISGNLSFILIPEPSFIMLLAIAFLSLATYRRLIQI